MPRTLADLADTEFERLELIRDDAAGLLGLVAIHSTRLGPAFGGIRRFAYEDFGEAVDDALRLARAMTAKCALAGVPGGGGKTVLWQRPGLDREAAYTRVGELVEQLGGRYYTGPDVGTVADDLRVVGRNTRYVASPDADGPGDLAEPTALGVFAGIRAVAARLYDGRELGPHVHVAVQGLGAVGGRLARLLAEAGCRLTIADIRVEATAELARELGAETVDPADVLAVPADVFAPCALGGVLDENSVGRLAARAVAGSANNVATGRTVDLELHRRGIPLVPDPVITSGALLHGAWFHLEGALPPPERILSIGDRVAELLAEAERRDLPPSEVAEQRVAEILAGLVRG